MTGYEMAAVLCPASRAGIVTKPEARECMMFAQWLRHQTLSGDFPFVWCHVPNESVGSPRYHINRLWMGVVPGFPDYVFLGERRAFGIEMKSANGRMSPKQQICRKWFKSVNVGYYLTRSCEEAIAVCEKELKAEVRYKKPKIKITS